MTLGASNNNNTNNREREKMLFLGDGVIARLYIFLSCNFFWYREKERKNLLTFGEKTTKGTHTRAG
jgi:hypothetical protein